MKSLVLCVLTILTGVSLSLGDEDLVFPDGFWWGTSLAAHQSEGGNHNSFTRWEDGGHIDRGEKSGLADDHWNRYPEDFKNLETLNANTHRMSIEWSRLEPEQGDWKLPAVQHYREMIQALKNKNIRPVICLFHFTLPLWVEDQGGFENPKTIADFARFAERAQQAFGDLTDDWMTINEPMAYVINAYQRGIFPPGVKDVKRSVEVTKNLILAHGRAYQILKKNQPASRVSVAHHLRVFTPLNKLNPFDWWAAHTVDQFFNWTWFDAIKTGVIKIDVPFTISIQENCPDCKNSIDYVGVNYYSRDLITFNLFSQDKFQVVPNDKAPKSDMGWEIYPKGLRFLLWKIKSLGFQNYPILITENGISTKAPDGQPNKEDWIREKFIYDHLKYFLNASREFGLKPMGYLAWSLMDNFEWQLGFDPRFGLYFVDYKTLARIPRESATYFGQMGKEKRLIPVPQTRSPQQL